MRDILLITLIGFSVSLFFIGFDDLNWNNIKYNFTYCFIIGSTLWKGNELVGYLLDRKFKWSDQPGKHLLAHILTVTLYSVFNIIVVNYLWFGLMQGVDFWHFVLHQNGLGILVMELLVTFMVALFLYTKQFLGLYKDSIRREEEWKRERLALQFDSLKNQVNPHFLFNSLNTLSSLVHKDQDQAVLFIKKLSDIYRYVLENRDKEIVTLETEMTFVENYIALQKIRFGDSLHISLQVNVFERKRVIPLSIQMLVENAMKHNVVSAEHPLKLEIYNEADDHIVVKNNLQKKRTIKSSRSDWERLGLANIKSRYEYMSEKNFIINDGDNINPAPDATHYIVKLPLLKEK